MVTRPMTLGGWCLVPVKAWRVVGCDKKSLTQPIP